MSEWYSVVANDEGDYYVIPADKVDDWYADDMFEFDVPYARPLNGALSRLRFQDWQVG